MKIKGLIAGLALATMSVMSVGAAQADEYPSRSITMICAWGAGGGSDAVARMIAGIMEKDLGQPIKVVNQTGGGGTIAFSSLSRAKPDGYTIGQVTAELAMNHWQNPAVQITYKDFEPLALVNVDPASVTLSATAPYKTYDEFVEYVKANPGKVRASATAVGGIWHIEMGQWLTALGLPVNAIKWIPTSGAGETYKEMAAGGIDAGFNQLSEGSTMYQAGKAIPVAVMADERDPKYPDVPTLKEKGIDVSIGTWRGFCVPKGTPQDIKDRLNAAIKKAVNDPQFVQFMNDRGFGIQYLEGEDFYKFMEKSDADLGASIEALGLARK